jgi:RNA polymerase sigma-70 factor (ECF subfamily)
MADSTPASQTRPSLLIRIRDARDESAWSVFVDVYAPIVYRYCRRRGLQDSDAADVSQEVLAQVARSIRNFEYQPERGRFRDWLGMVTHSKLADHFRAGKRAGQGTNTAIDAAGEPSDHGESGSEWAAAFNAHLLRVALDRIQPGFEPQTWRAFDLVWLQGRKASEAASSLNVPVDAIYVAKSRVLKRLREEVVALAEDLPLYVPLH